VDTRFDGINYDGREFRIYTSTNVSTMGKGNSNFLIEGTGETEGGLVNDAVLERNIQVEDLLGVELVFTQGVVAAISNAVSAGVIGTILLVLYSKTRAKKGSLTKE
jgi:hypothetical protein